MRRGSARTPGKGMGADRRQTTFEIGRGGDRVRPVWAPRPFPACALRSGNARTMAADSAMRGAGIMAMRRGCAVMGSP